ncbi:uncharacterized protein LOC110861107 [Folsomia candida]|uniref:Uncharacterized protein n=1 Tax=Folsomia candida TaxID=158441 RepID=A0A226D651_FOLCA|nr:uncharacterized protein LOC110861107 [Folsomia candida]OXA39736.1 hypothetical protein Fcan01_25592 [Folsomia candida]
MFLRLCVFLTCIYYAVGYTQEVTFYADYGLQGDALRIRSKHPQLQPCEMRQIVNMKSYCAIGRWEGYISANYTDRLEFSHTNNVTTCLNLYFNYYPISSIRYLGFSETLAPSISIYSGSNDSETGGIERTFTVESANNFGFIPTYLVLTGGSSWTGFSNEDFTGESTCFSTSELHVGFSPHPRIIRSFLKGCDAKYGSEIYEAGLNAE